MLALTWEDGTEYKGDASLYSNKICIREFRNGIPVIRSYYCESTKSRFPLFINRIAPLFGIFCVEAKQVLHDNKNIIIYRHSGKIVNPTIEDLPKVIDILCFQFLCGFSNITLKNIVKSKDKWFSINCRLSRGLSIKINKELVDDIFDRLPFFISEKIRNEDGIYRKIRDPIYEALKEMTEFTGWFNLFSRRVSSHYIM